MVTGVGRTKEWEEVGRGCVGQGTKGGALCTQANLDLGVRDIFRGSITGVRCGNIRMDMVMTMKALRLNQYKCGFILFGLEKEIQGIRIELEEKPLVCGNFVTKEKVDGDRWLGDQFVGGDTLGMSVTAKIDERIGTAKAGCMEIAEIVRDIRGQAAGGFKSGIQRFEASILPKLMYTCSTWTDILEESVKRLEYFQLWFIRLLLKAGPGAPRPSLLSETGMMSIERRIWREKIVLVLHISRMDTKSLGRKVLEEQVMFAWPGLGSDNYN